jgi:hypothetical protein
MIGRRRPTVDQHPADTRKAAAMTDTSHRPEQAAPDARIPAAEGTSAWEGWVVFGAVMMIMLGIVHVIQGLVALVNDQYFLVTRSGLVVTVDYTTWGWVHLVLGVIAGLAGIGLLAGNMAARVVGVAIAVVSALVNLAFMNAYPLWSIIVITLDVIVIFAIVVHGRELKSRAY